MLAPDRETFTKPVSNAPVQSQASQATSRVVSRLRVVGIAEGISFLLLLAVGMPLKYWAGMPMATKVFGWPHGILFVAYCVCLFQAARQMRWESTRTSALFIAALIPFGPFVMAPSLERDAAETP